MATQVLQWKSPSGRFFNDETACLRDEAEFYRLQVKQLQTQVEQLRAQVEQLRPKPSLALITSQPAQPATVTIAQPVQLVAPVQPVQVMATITPPLDVAKAPTTTPTPTPTPAPVSTSQPANAGLEEEEDKDTADHLLTEEDKALKAKYPRYDGVVVTRSLWEARVRGDKTKNPLTGRSNQMYTSGYVMSALFDHLPEILREKNYVINTHDIARKARVSNQCAVYTLQLLAKLERNVRIILVHGEKGTRFKLDYELFSEQPTYFKKALTEWMGQVKHAYLRTAEGMVNAKEAREMADRVMQSSCNSFQYYLNKVRKAAKSEVKKAEPVRLAALPLSSARNGNGVAH
jgi:hypothetical protein